MGGGEEGERRGKGGREEGRWTSLVDSRYPLYPKSTLHQTRNEGTPVGRRWPLLKHYSAA